MLAEGGGNIHHENAHLLLLALDLPDDAEQPHLGGARGSGISSLGRERNRGEAFFLFQRGGQDESIQNSRKLIIRKFSVRGKKRVDS
jgi:hypothetical protein